MEKMDVEALKLENEELHARVAEQESRERRFREVTHTLQEGSLPSRTAKLTIGGHDIYCTTAYDADHLCYIEIKVGHNAHAACVHRAKCPHCGTSFENERANDLATKVEENVRRQIEIICNQATYMLQARLWTEQNLIDAWRGTRFTPAGNCEQIPAQNLSTGEDIPGSHRKVRSPLDACAVYLERRSRRMA